MRSPSDPRISGLEFGKLRVVSSNGRPLAIAEVQFFGTDQTTPLTGTAYGTSETARLAFDGSTETMCLGSKTTENLAALEIDGPARSITKVRILAAKGREEALIGVAVAGLIPIEKAVAVIDRVEGSDGRSTSYRYATINNQVADQNYTVLSQVLYNDNTLASYKYANLTSDTFPLLVECDDPHYSGGAKKIGYRYREPKDSSELGIIHQELNPKTGGVYASLELDPKDPDKRIVHYSDLKQVVYRMPHHLNGRPSEKIDGLRRMTRFEYADGGKGRLISQSYANGRVAEFERSPDGRVTKISGYGAMNRGSGRSVPQTEKEFRFDENGRPNRIVDKKEHVTTIERDQRGRAVKITTQKGAQKFAYDNWDRIISIEEPDGRTHSFKFNDSGFRSEWINPSGGVTKYEYNAVGHRIAIIDPIGRVTRRTVDDNGRTLELTAPDGLVKKFTYDQYGRKITETDPNGKTTHWTYDELGRVTQLVDNRGGVTQLDYMELPHGCGPCTLTKNAATISYPDGRVIKNLHDGEGRLIARTENVGTSAESTTTYTYDDADNLISMFDPHGRMTRHTYDEDGHRISTTDPLGRTTLFAYDGDNLLSITTPSGAITQYEYDAQGRRIRVIDASGNVERFQYDANGNLVQQIDASGRKTNFKNQGAMRTAVIFDDGTRESTVYDAVGRKIKTVSVDNVETTFTYDVGDRLLGTSDNRGRKTARTYDALGRRISVTDALGRVTRWTYDARGNVIATHLPDGTTTLSNYDAQDLQTFSTDALGLVTRYAYDLARNMTSLVDARGNKYSFIYDAAGRKTAMIYPDGSRETWTYDLTGLPVLYVNRAGQTKTTDYNSAGQPVSETWTQAASSAGVSSSAMPVLAPNVRYTYDASGHLITLDNGMARLTYAHDSTGRIAAETASLEAIVPGLPAHTVGYRFDANGRRSELRYPDNSQVVYAYDRRGRLTSIDGDARGKPLAAFAYDEFGQIRKLVRKNNVVTNYSYDTSGQLTSIEHTNGGRILASSRYDLDALGRRTTRTSENGVTERYSYDANGQLISVNYGSGGKSELFVYDAVGNRVNNEVSTRIDRLETYITNASNQYTALRGVPLEYDLNGNLVNDGRNVYRYDSENRLVASESIHFQVPTRTEYYYDALDRCVLRKNYSKSSQGTWELDVASSMALTYSTSWSLLAERNLNGADIGKYIESPRVDEIITAILNGIAHFPLADALGNTVALTDTRGKITERFDYDAFGAARVFNANYQIAKNPSNYRFLFQGREWLSNVRLSDHRNRYYSPDLGRWLTTDPIGFEAKDVNLYRFVGNSPTNFTDPLGHAICLKEPEQTICDNAVVNALNGCLNDADVAYENSVNHTKQTCETPCFSMCRVLREACLVTCSVVVGAAQTQFGLAKMVAYSGCGYGALAAKLTCEIQNTYTVPNGSPCNPGDRGPM